MSSRGAEPPIRVGEWCGERYRIANALRLGGVEPDDLVIRGTELERWLRDLDPQGRAAVRAALARDPDLVGEVRLLLADLPPLLRDGFLERFAPAAARAERPARAVIEGLRGAAKAAVVGRGKARGRPS
jgi:hypothetical protein